MGLLGHLCSVFLNIVDFEISALIDLGGEITGNIMEEKACLLIILGKA